MADIQKYIEFYWISLVCNKSYEQYETIIDYFGNLHEAWKKTSDKNFLEELYDAEPSEILIHKMCEEKYRKEAKFSVEKTLEKGFGITCIEDEDYPVMLRDYPIKPLVLFYKGNLAELNKCEHFIGVVGSRNYSDYGRQITKKIVSGLVGKRIAVISGMARGIDTFAHTSALENNLFTVCVLGCGIDKAYPAENSIVYNKVSQKGLIISEYPIGTTPQKYYFPARNRIIAGLSEIVLVTEAGEKSGALITSDFALDYGRDVAAVPSNANAVYGKGSNDLIKRGAACITEANDILLYFGYDENEIKLQFDINALDETEKRIYDVILHSSGLMPDEICERTYIAISTIQKKLPGMCLNNILNKSEHGIYTANF